MLETSTVRKNKISLSDYDYKKDIESRLLLSSFSELELTVLEEIIFSSIKTSISKLSQDLDIPEKQIVNVLEKLEKVQLLKIDSHNIIIEKKIRKYFEFEFLRFDENFKPDLPFISNLLAKIPIHILPIWYLLPKTSNNIFQSIIDKYFLTPQIFQRYIEDLENENPIFSCVIKALYNSNVLSITSKELKEKHDLDDAKYFEYLMLLEFNFICFQSYKKTAFGYEEVLTPFYEYTEYLNYYKNTQTPSITNIQKLIKKRNSDFGFVEDMSFILQIAKKKAAQLQIENIVKKELSIKDPQLIELNSYINNLINKLLQINFLIKKQGVLQTSPMANKWLELSIDHRALHFYYHPLNLLTDANLPKCLFTEKNIREAEKSILRVVKKGWVYFDDFIKGVISPITDEHQLKIKPVGKVFRYIIPSYSKEDAIFIKKVIFERLFEAGIVNIGIINGKDCFCVTQLGESFFDIS